jgi:hypothetical protein
MTGTPEGGPVFLMTTRFRASDLPLVLVEGLDRERGDVRLKV